MPENKDHLPSRDLLSPKRQIEIPFTAEQAVAVMEKKRQSVLLINLYENTHAIGSRINPGGEVNHLLMEIADDDLSDRPDRPGVSRDDIWQSKDASTLTLIETKLNLQRILMQREPADLIEEEVMLLTEIQGAYHLLAWRVLNASDLNSEIKASFSTEDEHLSPVIGAKVLLDADLFFEANPDMDRPIAFSEPMRTSVRSIYNRYQALFDFYNRHPERFEITKETFSVQSIYDSHPDYYDSHPDYYDSHPEAWEATKELFQDEEGEEDFVIWVDGQESFRRIALTSNFMRTFRDPEFKGYWH